MMVMMMTAEENEMNSLIRMTPGAKLRQDSATAGPAGGERTVTSRVPGALTGRTVASSVSVPTKPPATLSLARSVLSRV